CRDDRGHPRTAGPRRIEPVRRLARPRPEADPGGRGRAVQHAGNPTDAVADPENATDAPTDEDAARVRDPGFVAPAPRHELPELSETESGQPRRHPAGGPGPMRDRALLGRRPEAERPTAGRLAAR